MMNNVAILTFHSVLDQKDDRPWAFLSTSVKAFENTLKYLKKHGYTSISLSELYELKRNKSSDNQKRIVINFDDGFLDNFTIAYPLLKKYGFKATVYVSSEFVDPRPIVRKLAYDDIINGKGVNIEDNWGYMSWDELRILDQSGVIDVQAHAMSHTWYFVSDKLKDVHHPVDRYFWLWWNDNTSKKPFWLTSYCEQDVEYGYPVFEYAKSLAGRRFIPSDDAINFSIDYYRRNKEEYRKNKVAYLDKLRREMKSQFPSGLGIYENDKDFYERIKAELTESKKILEGKMGKRIDFLAWPGGAVCDYAYKTAQNAGYLAVTSKEKHYNEIAIDPLDKLYRMGAWSGLKRNGQPILFLEKLFIAMQLLRTKGNNSFINRIIDKIGDIYRKRNIEKNRKQGEHWK